MALTSRLAPAGPQPSEPEDLLESSLGVIYPDDVANHHGDAGHPLVYTSPFLPRPLRIEVAEPEGDEQRRLFSHYLWNASLLLAELIESGTLHARDPTRERAGGGEKELPPKGAVGGREAPAVGVEESYFDVGGLWTIELGAGTALPSIMAALLGADRVVVTDYPAPSVMTTLRDNIERNVRPENSPLPGLPTPKVTVEGHIWGEMDTPLSQGNRHSFDRVFVADCLWMPWQHENLLRSIDWFLKDGDKAARCWVVAGFHTGRAKVSSFFDSDALAGAGLEIESLWERNCDGDEREWAWTEEQEDIDGRKRWLAVGVLRRLANTTGRST